MTFLVKRIASMVLCIAFFLPLSQCTPKEGIMETHSVPVTITAYSAYEWPSVASTIAATLFFWPILVQVLAFIRPPRLKSHRWAIAEISLCSLTGLGISWLLFWGDTLRFGVFVAYGAIIAYAGSSICDLLKRPTNVVDA